MFDDIPAVKKVAPRLEGEARRMALEAESLEEKIRGSRVRNIYSEKRKLYIVLEREWSVLPDYKETVTLEVKSDVTIGLDGGIYAITRVSADGHTVWND